MGTPAYIGLGSNLGDRRAILDAAVESLGRLPGTSLSAVSRYLETAPVGGPSGQGPFLNAVAAIDTALEPFELLSGLQAIEANAGRVRTQIWGERTLDLDLLLHGESIVESPTLSVPHPWMAVRRFVLAPLGEIAADRVHPTTGKTVRSLLENLDRRPSVLCLLGCWRDPDPAWRSAFQRVVQALNAFDVSPNRPELSRETAHGREIDPNSLAYHLERRGSHPDRWIVADFAPSEFDGVPDSNRTGSPAGHPAWGLGTLLRPTIIVRRPAEPANPIRGHGLREDGVPTLVLDSDSPGELAEKMIAACRATRFEAATADPSGLPAVLRYDAAD